MSPPPVTTDTPEDRWRAMCARDPAADGRFVFAVVTTGVYCRPSCSARRARRENVRFFDTPAAAEAAGFRPCKRCRPELGEALPHAAAIAAACATIRAAEVEPPLAELAAAAGLSPERFRRVFKAQVGLTPKRFAMAVRKQRLRDGLGTARTVTEAIHQAGYGSAARAYAEHHGPPPRRQRAGMAGETLSLATAPTSLGEIVVAASPAGVCLVEFLDGRDPAAVLAARFPDARPAPGPGTGSDPGSDPGSELGAALDDWLAAVVACVEGAPGPAVELPLDIRGTVFQEKVWQALRALPPGRTVSYGELAAALDHPGAARAVAGAVADNRLAVVVPCHRVIRGSGALAGYRWGMARKRALLAREAGEVPAGED
ncbi:methylated-DNA--[protein]-cysteine S-methyltransferase [Roseospirillum parvum]|uniref:methylated-DNA--[protein]-cysteine S-methyltransferase n=1 Tax=Roseospirillum parvum TaxID=83401 RepID=A0A1G7ZKM2_9PROT|nr:methylated-DNA--[protein]-cysteine S-methyltransferase [Roseospirillum parvum]SDH09228.1 AraC family transcriptional regulator, regulatory protein of adaptative response / methylated-DNA-[protein]-cysteine methyltransferase [Roseospirillum parvum]